MGLPLLIFNGLVEAGMKNGKPLREPAWSESIDVGGKTFIENIVKELGVKARGRNISKMKDNF